MNQVNQKAVNISAPNLVNICINGLEHGEIQGEVYHYYSEKPESFSSVVELIRTMEKLFDYLMFPQASTRIRSFWEKENEIYPRRKREDKQVSWEELLAHSGRIGTFITCVKFRQRSTWQGDFFWKEKEQKMFFSSALEFVRLLDQAVNQEQKKEKEEHGYEHE
ncbi:MAG: hypothetical protein E7253_02860 [Lachnospiraceae bacterium]|nr:hypothetical protein [Lachnospiraceae bacterium]